MVEPAKLAGLGLVFIPPGEVVNVLRAQPVCMQWLLEVQERSQGEISAQAFIEQASRGHGQMWVVWDDWEQEPLALVGTQVEQTACGGKLARILFVRGGGSTKWLHMIGHIESWAREQGCERLVAWARPGYKLRLKTMGYRERHVELVKELIESQSHGIEKIEQHHDNQPMGTGATSLERHPGQSADDDGGP